MRILVVNAGSSSVKLRLVEDDDSVSFTDDLPALADDLDTGPLLDALDGVGEVDAVGHRVVHGGTRFTQPVLVDDGVFAALEDLVDLAPLHQPESLAAIAALRREWPSVPAVACFDTAFHAGMPPAASTYALPPHWRDGLGLRRYGFHGLSHAYAARKAAELVGRPPEALRIVTAHLGAGASLAAVEAGRSVDTTMGFTPLEGLVMATRSGSVDPALVLWLEQHGTPAAEVGDVLENHSGLLGLCGTADMREVLERAGRGEAEASLALDVYLHRLRAGIAAMTAAMDGLDVLVFTGGVGERAPDIREAAANGLGFLGVAVDHRLNEEPGLDRLISPPDSPVVSAVIGAREDLEIARGVRDLLGANPPSTGFSR